MNRAQRIEQLLIAHFSPTRLKLDDESARHAGHAGASADGQTHYALSIESEQFAGLSKIKRHQAIYAVLADEFKTGLHALSIEAKCGGNGL